MEDLYIITGAAGHLGSTIIRNLKDRNCCIRGLVMPSERKEFTGRVEYFTGDITALDSLEDIFSGTEGYNTYVIHTAGLISIGGDDYRKLYDVNVGGTRNMISKCIEHHVRRLVYVSSVHAIPEENGKVISEVSEFDSYDVDGNYAKTKAEATEAVLEACRDGQLDAVIVHPSGIIGPYDSGHNHLVQLVKMYISGKLPAGIDGGYDFVDVRDVAEGCLEALEKGRAGECYILSNEYISIRSLFESIRKVVGGRRKPCLPIWIAKLFEPVFGFMARITHTRPLYTRYAISTVEGNGHFSHMKATRELGYRPRKMDTTIADTIAWLKAEA